MISNKIKFITLASVLSLASLGSIAAVNVYNPKYVNAANNAEIVKRGATIDVATGMLDVWNSNIQEIKDGFPITIEKTPNRLTFKMNKHLESINKEFMIHELNVMKIEFSYDYNATTEDELSIVINGEGHSFKMEKGNFFNYVFNTPIKDVKEFTIKSKYYNVSHYIQHLVRVRLAYGCEVGR